MKIESIIKTRSSGDLRVEYFDAGEAPLQDETVHHVCGFCFYKDKFVVVFNEKSLTYTPPAGGREAGESIEAATAREIAEESNMKVLRQELIGHQEIYEPHRKTIQTRSFCIVEPYGDFVSDPDGDITHIKLIDPADVAQYFNWGEIGEHIMKRALELKAQYEKKLRESEK